MSERNKIEEKETFLKVLKNFDSFWNKHKTVFVGVVYLQSNVSVCVFGTDHLQNQALTPAAAGL